MNRNKATTWAFVAAWGLLFVGGLLSIGCSPLNVFAYVFAKDEKVKARSPLTFDKDSPKRDQDEVVVAILPQARGDFGPQFALLPGEVADKIGKILPELAKENKEKRKFKVLGQAQVDKFKATTPNWKRMSADEIGQKLGADFVLEIWLDKLRLYDPASNNLIYEGRAEVQVTVYEVGAKDGIPKDSYNLSFDYPKGMPRAADSMPLSTFKAQFVDNLALKIARQHVEYKASNDFAADGR
ncbi:MAG: hypothetical protein K2V38_14695 [Gemmataceae bacterium]|nr:hypothetical protein [Gemmataceae bacterium]